MAFFCLTQPFLFPLEITSLKHKSVSPQTSPQMVVLECSVRMKCFNEFMTSGHLGALSRARTLFLFSVNTL